MEFQFELLKKPGFICRASLEERLALSGGLIVGQAAVEAGIVSTIVVIVVSFSNCLLYRAKWIVRVRFFVCWNFFLFSRRGNLGNLWIFTHFCSITLSFITVRILWCSLYAAICLWGEFEYDEKRRLCPLSICLYMLKRAVFTREGRRIRKKEGRWWQQRSKVFAKTAAADAFIGNVWGRGAVRSCLACYNGQSGGVAVLFYGIFNHCNSCILYSLWKDTGAVFWKCKKLYRNPSKSIQSIYFIRFTINVALFTFLGNDTDSIYAEKQFSFYTVSGGASSLVYAEYESAKKSPLFRTHISMDFCVVWYCSFSYPLWALKHRYSQEP